MTSQAEPEPGPISERQSRRKPIGAQSRREREDSYTTDLRSQRTVATEQERERGFIYHRPTEPENSSHQELQEVTHA